jgi:hypothetical protein
MAGDRALELATENDHVLELTGKSRLFQLAVTPDLCTCRKWKPGTLNAWPCRPFSRYLVDVVCI